MKLSPNLKTQIPDEDYYIWEAHGFKCVLCPGWSWAVCLHESPPKSLNPKWKQQPETRFPLCSYHHDQIHEMNWRDADNHLRRIRREKHPFAEERILNEYNRQNQRNNT